MDLIAEVYGADGRLQISDVHFGIGLSGYGAVTLTDDGATHPQPIVRAVITVAGVAPVLAFRPQLGKKVTVEQAAPISGGFQFVLLCQSMEPVGLQYWVFDVAGQTMLDPTLNDFEAAIYDDTGAKTFDMAMQATMRVVEAAAFALPSYASPPPQMGSMEAIVANVAVPADREFAIVQATLAFATEQFDTGGYSSESERPWWGETIGDGSPPPPGTLWRYQKARSYRSTGGFTSASNVEVGFTQVEDISGDWYEFVIGAGYASQAGNLDFLILDVTYLPSTPMPAPGAVSVTVDAALREVTLPSGGPADTITPTATASGSGGTGPYSYAWIYHSGSVAVSPSGSTALPAFQTTALGQSPGTMIEAKWRCRATDALGAIGWSEPVTFRHTVQYVNYIPNPISVSNLTLVTDDNAGRTNTSLFQIVGTTAPITLRFTRSNNAGDAYLRRQFIYVGSSPSGPWTEHFMGVLTAPLDISVAPGTYIYVQGAFETLSGRGTGSWDMTIANQFTGGGIIATWSVSGVVDDNNDFNVPDYTLTPGAIALTNNSVTTTTGDASASFGGGYANGINRAIALTAVVSPVFRGGSVASFFTVYVGAGSASWDAGDTADKSFSWTANPGDFVGASAALSMFSGAGDAWAYWHVDLYNSTTGEFVSGFDGGLTTSR